jgi:hypothetical protein
MIKRFERLKNTVNKYMAYIRPDRHTTCQSERKSVVSRRPSVSVINVLIFVRRVTSTWSYNRHIKLTLTNYWIDIRHSDFTYN